MAVRTSLKRLFGKARREEVMKGPVVSSEDEEGWEAVSETATANDERK